MAPPTETAVLAEVAPQPANDLRNISIARREAPAQFGGRSAGVSNEEHAPDSASGFLGQSEIAILDTLRTQAIRHARKGSGGRTLAFKLELADGTRAYFKPEQQVSSAHWYAEVAAYYLDRALGLGRVPPVVSRRVRWDQLQSAAEGDRRVPEVKVSADGSVRGALIYWLPKHLVAAETPPGWENWLRIKPFARWAVSPYQASTSYGAALAHAHDQIARGQPGDAYYDDVPLPARPELPAELSDMIVFDFLTLNYDRWGGDNTNVLTLGVAGPLIFLDNGDGFSVGPARRGLLDARLAPLQRFRKRTVEALKALDVRALGERMAHDALAPILDAHMLEGLELRRRALLEHVVEQVRRFGDAVYAW
ncbi:MAG TPA: hypothetical protein VF331_16010 [Polyangiales bacterium]